MLFVGDDWAEDHHDIEIVDEQGRRLVRRRLEEDAAGLAALHALIADHLDDQAEPEQVVVGIETDRGPWVQALLAAGTRSTRSTRCPAGAVRHVGDGPGERVRPDAG